MRRDVKRDDEVPTFYNAAVERDLHDPRGYDVLFIDGMVKGSVLTRASHSCQPNAEMRVRVREGKYSVEMVTTREVRTGEEICWDYRCQTDSEKEMRRAICLCGSKNCRVSYLHYNGESELAAFADERCAVLHDAARLLASCVDADALRLPETLTLNPKGTPGKGTPGKRGNNGGKRADDHWKSALIAAGVRADDEGMLAGLPQWARKFASKCVATAHEEKKFLTHSLYESAKRRAYEAIDAARAEVAEYETDPEAWKKRFPRAVSTPPTVAHEPSDADLRADAKAEASGIHAARIQSLAVTMDKVRRVLAVHARGGDAEKPAAGVDVSAAAPPLRLLNDEDAAAHLVAYASRLASAANVDNPFDALSVDRLSAADDENGSDEDARRWVRSDAARRILREMADNLWKRSLEESGASDTDRIARLACGDLAYLASQTRNFFAPVAGGERFKSPYVAMGSHGSRDGAGVVRRMDYPKHSALGFLCTWREEYLERPCDRLATDARGGLCLPRFDRGALANYSTQNPGKNRRRCGAPHASIDALSAHLCREMAARGGGKAWAPIDGCWRWDFDLDAGDERDGPVLGSPVVDAALGGDVLPGASAAAELAAARRAVLGDDVEDARVADAELGKAVASKDGNEEEKKEEEKEEEEKEEKKEEEEERVALGAAETDADAVAAEPTLPIPERSRPSPRVVTSPPVNRWGEPEPHVPCVVCGDVGDATDFILCDGCPSGGHVDCLNLPANPALSRNGTESAHSRDDWFCDACEGGKLAGIQPPGRGGFALAAANRAALERARERNGGVATVSAVPGATGAVPSVGPVAAHNLAEYHPVHLTTNCEVVALPGDPPPPPPTMPLTSSG